MGEVFFAYTYFTKHFLIFFITAYVLGIRRLSHILKRMFAGVSSLKNVNRLSYFRAGYFSGFMGLSDLIMTMTTSFHIESHDVAADMLGTPATVVFMT